MLLTNVYKDVTIMATKKVLRSFNVSAQINIWTSSLIQATSLEDAVERSKGLGVTDFITVDGEHIDSNYAVIGVSDENLPDLDI